MLDLVPPPAKSIRIHDIDTQIPGGLPIPEGWRLWVMPVATVRKTSGGIILPDDVVDAQNWAHRLCKIAAVGSKVYKGPVYKANGFTDDDVPKVGDLYLVNPRNPNRIIYNELTFLLVNDDQLEARVDPNCVSKLKFFGFNLG